MCIVLTSLHYRGEFACLLMSSSSEQLKLSSPCRRVLAHLLSRLVHGDWTLPTVHLRERLIWADLMVFTSVSEQRSVSAALLEASLPTLPQQSKLKWFRPYGPMTEACKHKLAWFIQTVFMCRSLNLTGKQTYRFLQKQQYFVQVHYQSWSIKGFFPRQIV